MAKYLNTGAKVALMIGMPLGLIFSFLVLYISLFPPFDLGIYIVGGKLFWYQSIWIIHSVVFIFLLWNAGRKIKLHLDKNYSIIKSSLLFTLSVNSYLFLILFLIFSVSALNYSVLPAFISIGIILVLLFIAYTTATVFTTFTIGVLIVKITKTISKL